MRFRSQKPHYVMMHFVEWMRGFGPARGWNEGSMEALHGVMKKFDRLSNSFNPLGAISRQASLSNMMRHLALRKTTELAARAKAAAEGQADALAELAAERASSLLALQAIAVKAAAAAGGVFTPGGGVGLAEADEEMQAAAVAAAPAAQSPRLLLVRETVPAEDVAMMHAGGQIISPFFDAVQSRRVQRTFVGTGLHGRGVAFLPSDMTVHELSPGTPRQARDASIVQILMWHLVRRAAPSCLCQDAGGGRRHGSSAKGPAQYAVSAAMQCARDEALSDHAVRHDEHLAGGWRQLVPHDAGTLSGHTR